MRSPRPRRPKVDTNDRRTPRWFFTQCERRFGPFDIDVAAIFENTQCGLFINPAENALDPDVRWAGPWGSAGRARQAWCNPPYGPPGTIERWIAKARTERNRDGMRTLMLLPADTSTKWYHDVTRTELTELVPFRLAFDAPDHSTQGNSAKFGSVLVWIAPVIAASGKGQ